MHRSLLVPRKKGFSIPMSRRDHGRFTRGFTLIELMIVVVIISILAAIAYPSYTEYVRRGILVEASEALTAAKMSMDQFYLSKRSFATAQDANGPCTKNERKSFTITCQWNSANPLNYTLTATGTGRVAGFTYTIDQAGSKTTAVTVGGGWPATKNCWIFSKGGPCV